MWARPSTNGTGTERISAPRARLIPAGLTPGRFECGHHFLGDPLELFEHRRLRRADRARKADMLHAGITLLEALQELDELFWGACEPRAQIHVVFHRRHVGSSPAAAPRYRGHLIGGQPRHKA